MKILYSSHDELYESHVCPECNSYWAFCSSCGVIETKISEAHIWNSDQYICITYGKCKSCGEPMAIYPFDKVHYERCPSCEKWNSKGTYKEWIIDE